MRRLRSSRILLAILALGLLIWIYFPAPGMFQRSVYDPSTRTRPPATALTPRTPDQEELDLEDEDDEDKAPEPVRYQITSLASYNQTHPSLADIVRQEYIDYPSTQGFAARIAPNGLVLAVWPILSQLVKDGKNGFFVEAGAYDGVTASNTLWLEQEHGWSGLLIECHPLVYPILKGMNRKAYISGACLSQYDHPAVAELTSVDGWSPSSSLGTEKSIFPDFAKTFTKYDVQTVPLYTTLAAINVSTVDFISLDIQGFEYKVLQHFLFDKIFVKVWLIEIDLLSDEEEAKLKKLMRKNGYLRPVPIGESDMLFVHKSVMPRRKRGKEPSPGLERPVHDFNFTSH